VCLTEKTVIMQHMKELLKSGFIMPFILIEFVQILKNIHILTSKLRKEEVNNIQTSIGV